MKHVTAFLVTLLLLLTCTACSEEDTLTGTWEGPLEVSVLGVEAEAPGDVTGTIRLTFTEEGAGTMETEVPSQLPVMEPSPYQYTTDAEKLTLTFDNGQTMTFTYHLKGDTLTLEGRADLTLTRTQ